MKEITVHETRVETYDGEIHKDREAAEAHLLPLYDNRTELLGAILRESSRPAMSELERNTNLVLDWATVRKDYHEFESAFPEEDES